MVHIPMGDLLRARAKFLPELGEFISNGWLVPDDVVVSVLKERLADSDCASRGVLLDGFPRTRAQAESLRRVGVEISAVLHLQVADDVVVDRIAGRRIDPLSGKIYHVKDNPPPPEIAGRVIQREDDTPEKIRRRLVTYHQERDAILDFCGDRVRTIHVGDGSGEALPSDVRPLRVFDEVRKAVEGDTYWGSVIRSEFIAKAFECGSESRTLISLARYFEHARYRLVQKGCLADAAAKVDRIILRSQVLRVLRTLEPLEQYELRTWLDKVRPHSVLVGHTITQRSAEGEVVEVARGWAVLIFLQSDRVMEVPDAGRLAELALPEPEWTHGVAHAASPEALADMVAAAPPDCWQHRTCVAAVDLDLHGCVHEATCLAYMERWRFYAASAQGNPSWLNEAVLRARTRQAYVAYAGYAGAGDCILVRSWVIPAPTTKDTSIMLAFEVQASGGKEIAGRASPLLLRGCLVLDKDCGSTARL